MSGTVVVVNPLSQGGKTHKLWPQHRETILGAYGPFESVFTERAGDGTDKARAALQGGAELVIAMGGDGTINEVVNGFFDAAGKPISATASFAVLNAGTGGDFRKSLGVPLDLAEAAARIKGATPRRIDVGRLNYIDHQSRPASRYFINIASFGLSGLVDRYVNQSTKALGGTLSFAMDTIRAGINYKNASISMRLDGGPAKEGRIYTVAVANGRYFGGGMYVAPNAEIDDGLFDVVTLGDFSFGDVLLRGLDIYSGKHLTNPKVTVVRASKVEVEPLAGNSDVLLDVDGEQIGRLPATFEILKGGLQVRFPKL